MCVQAKAHDGDGIDGVAIGALAVSAIFGLFSLIMTITSARYILINLTTVDFLKSKNVVHQLAIRVPRGTPPGPNYHVITYPLPTSPSGMSLSGMTVTDERFAPSPRDRLATRTFAIVRTEMGENPWDLGYYGNWKSVMGERAVDWFLPVKGSPCARHEAGESFYEMGPLYGKLRARFGLAPLREGETEGVEMMVREREQMEQLEVEQQQQRQQQQQMGNDGLPGKAL